MCSFDWALKGILMKYLFCRDTLWLKKAWNKWLSMPLKQPVEVEHLLGFRSTMGYSHVWLPFPWKGLPFPKGSFRVQEFPHERHAVSHDISWARIAMFGLCCFDMRFHECTSSILFLYLGRATVEERCHNKHRHIANSLGWKLPLGTSFYFSARLNGFCCQCFHCSIRGD